MHQFIAKHLVYYPIQILRGQKVKRCMQQVMPLQHASNEELSVIRDRKIINLINYAYEYVPYYHDKFVERSIHPNQVDGFRDLSCLPILSKYDILSNEEKLVTNNASLKFYTRKTGGSTGMTLHFKKGANALALNDAIMWRCYGWYGIDVGDRQVRFWGVPITRRMRFQEQLKDCILNRIRISAFDISSESCLRQYERIRKFRPAYFYGYTTAIYGFCLFMKKSGIDLNELDLKAIVCTAEKMYPHHRKLFNEVFECPVVDEYGCAEHGIIAFQCKEGNMHMMSDHLCVEFLDENDQPVKVGEPGRIVITDLSSYAMPLIRYDIGDIGKQSDRECSCGIKLPLMEVVEGRKEDFLRTKEGKLIHAAYLCYTLKEDTVYEFKMYQKAIDLFYVEIVKSPAFTENSEKVLERRLRFILGEDVHITFKYLDRIPREPSGKLRYFVSELTVPDDVPNAT